MPYPLFTKARTIGNECALVLPLNYDRHFGPSFDQLIKGQDGFTDFPFLDKISKVIISSELYRISKPMTRVLSYSFPPPPT